MENRKRERRKRFGWEQRKKARTGKLFLFFFRKKTHFNHNSYGQGGNYFLICLPYFFPWQTLQHFPGNWIGSSQSSFGHSFLIFRHWTLATIRRLFVTYRQMNDKNRLSSIKSVWIEHFAHLYMMKRRKKNNIKIWFVQCVAYHTSNTFWNVMIYSIINRAFYDHSSQQQNTFSSLFSNFLAFFFCVCAYEI